MGGRNVYFFQVDGPLLAAPSSGTMKACGFFDGLETLIRTNRGNFGDVIERHGIDARAIRDLEYAVPCSSAAAILDYCSNAYDDRLFGLRLGKHLKADGYGAITSFARVAPDVRSAIEVLLEYMPVLYCPGAEAELVTAGGVAEFRWRPLTQFPSDEQANYLGQSQVVQFFESLLGPDFRPSSVQLCSRPWRNDLETMERFFGCRVHGGAEANIISFPSVLLEKQVMSANELLFGLMGSYFAQVRSALQQTFVDQVRAYAGATLATGNCTIERCAVKLGASARTIQRRLTEAGLRFSEIVEEQRIEASKRALTQTIDALSDIALNLGYSDQSSFGRAFKRWTGMTPQGYRDGTVRPH